MENTHSPSINLELEHVEKRYPNGFTAVSDLNLAVSKGEMIGLLGPSGCGKTTALRMIAGLLPLTHGSIKVDGVDITTLPAFQRDIGLVFQNYALFPHMSVAENVAFGLSMRKVPRSEIRERVSSALAMVRLPDFGDRRIKDMSGGQQQRVALARALVIRPRILLLDEPLSNLDAKLRDEMRFEIREIQQRLGITTVFVTHDQVEALTMCDRVALMSQGKLAQLGTPKEIYERPQSLFVAKFVGRTNVFEARIFPDGGVTVGNFSFRTETTGLSADNAKVVIRPHRIHLSPSRDLTLLSTTINSVSCLVRQVTYIGDMVQYLIDAGGLQLRVEQPSSSRVNAFKENESVTCEWSPSDTLVILE
jgi:putative spermidine/putrescine transport system ATP-binding protein